MAERVEVCAFAVQCSTWNEQQTDRKTHKSNLISFQNAC